MKCKECHKNMMNLIAHGKVFTKFVGYYCSKCKRLVSNENSATEEEK